MRALNLTIESTRSQERGIERIRAVVPVLSAPLVASVILELENPTQAQVVEAVIEKLKALKSNSMPRPRRDADELVADILKRFERRSIVSWRGDTLQTTETGRPVLAYYARSVAHHFPETTKISAIAK